MFPFFEYPNQEVVFAQCQISDFYLEIFDRWGEIIFKSTDLNKQWDGVYKGLPAMGGVYGFILRYKYFDSCDQLDRIVNTNGNFTIIR
jgi:gliding motility-associated-like protein